MGYWGANYWGANYWASNYWGVATLAAPGRFRTLLVDNSYDVRDVSIVFSVAETTPEYHVVEVI